MTPELIQIQTGADIVPLPALPLDLAHVCAFLEPSVRNSLKIRGRFSDFQKV